MMSASIFSHTLRKMVDNLLKYLYLEFGITIAYIIQIYIKKHLIFQFMMRNDDVIAE